MSKTEIIKVNNHDKYVGGNKDVIIKWDGKTELNNYNENEGYAYLHQTPPYRVRFKFTKDEITAIFDTACNILYHQDSTSSLQTNKETGHQDSYWFFGYPVGFEIYTSTNSNKIECTNTWSWVNSNNAKTLSVSKKWEDIIGKNTNIKSYLYADNKVYFRPICQGCCRPNRDHPVPFIDDHDDYSLSNIGKNCVRCAKYGYVLEKAHQHIAKPEITLLKTTGTTIKIKASDGNIFEGMINTDSRYNDSTNNELLFTNLKKETTYILTIRQKCSCGNYIYSNSKKIKTWNVILDDKKSSSVLNCGGYHRIHVAAKQKEGTRGINNNSDSGNDGIRYDLYNSINNRGNIGTHKTLIDRNHNDGNNYTERDGRYSSIAKFTGLDSNTYYYCKAYSINNITNQDNNTPDTIKESIFKTAKRFTVDNVSITPKNESVNICATISNLDDTYIKNNNDEYINGLDSLEISVINKVTKEKTTNTLTNLTISNIKDTYSFKISTSVDDLSSGTSYDIMLNFIGYSKYGIDHTTDTNEECKRSINRSFTTTSAGGEIINLESSIKAVKFDFKINDSSLGSQNDTESKYKAILYKTYETSNPNSDNPNATTVNEDLYVDKYIDNNNNRPNYELLIPNNKFTNYDNTSKIVKGLSFGVFNQRGNTYQIGDTFEHFLYGEDDYNTYIESSVGISCNTTYRIKIVDTTNNDNIVAVYDFDTKQLEAKTDIIARQDSIKVITKPIITTSYIDENTNNTISTASYIDEDTINTKSKIRTVIEYQYYPEYNRTDLIRNSYGIEAYSHKDYRNDNDLNNYVYNNDLSANNDNAIFKENPITDIDGKTIYNYICHDGLNNQDSNQDHEINIINDQANQYDHTEIIHKFNNLTYYCYHRVIFYLTDGYNNTLIEIYCNTAFPYAFISLSSNEYTYPASQIETYVYHDGDWKIVIPHIYKKYLDSNDEEHTKWMVCDGNQEEIS